MRKRPSLLFSKYDLYSKLQGQEEKIKNGVDEVPTKQLLESDVDETIATLVNKLRIEPIQILDDEITVEQSETKVDVSQDFMRGIDDRSKPFYINGTKITYYVPFSGERTLLECRPNHFNDNPPRAVIDGQELLFEYEFVDGTAATTKTAFDHTLNHIKQWIGWVEQQVEEYNQSLKSKVSQQVSDRKQRLIEAQQQVSDLGFKIRPKASQPQPSVGNSPTIGSTPSNRSKRTLQQKERSYDVALSFAGEDREYVEKVALLLRAAGIRVFYDNFEKAELWGKNLIDHFAKIYAGGSHFVVMFVSKYYAAKAWTNHERKQAQAHAFKAQKDFILPARFDDTEISGLLDTVGYLDLRTISPEDLVDIVLKKLSPNDHD